MSYFRIKTFSGKEVSYIEKIVNAFIKENDIEVFKFTLTSVEWSRGFVGVLEYEIEE